MVDHRTVEGYDRDNMSGMREHPRFVAGETVEIQAEGRNELRNLWMTDISKGGLFVQTDTPPPMRTRVTVTLSTPDGAVDLAAEVVHILDAERAAAMGTSSGVGLQFVDLDGPHHEAIEKYVEGLNAKLIAQNPSGADESQDVEDVIAIMKTFLEAFEREDLYGALAVDPAAEPRTIETKVQAIAAILGTPPTSLSVVQASRAAHVRTLVLKVGALLTHRDRRLDYDLRHGHVFARQRLADADVYERSRLRRMWHRLYPDHLAVAEKHANEAVHFEGIMKYPEAIASAQKALEHDPFNVELWEAVDTWAHRLQVLKEQESLQPRPPGTPMTD